MAAKYLGVFVGPEKGTKSWDSPIAKFLKRSAQWGSLGLGLSMSIRAYATYISSVLLVVAQFEALPDNFSKTEAQACRRLFPGPMHWISADVLKQLKQVAFPVELRCVQTCSVAAKSRLLRCENLKHGGLDIRRRARLSREKLTQCDRWERLGWAHQWWQQQFVFQLERADDRVQLALDANTDQPPSLLQEWYNLEANGVEPSAKRRRRQLSWQAVSGQLLKPPTSVPLFSHFDRKLRKMVLRCLPWYRARHAIGVITSLSSLVAPRVVAADIRSVCNGWSTLQCYQQRGRCKFGCSHPADSLVHIAKCPRANAWGSKWLIFSVRL